jgi:delta 1-pyrroline-5-carboxylate dehydrogenase
LASAEVEPAARKQLLTMVDRLISELTTFIDQNKATIESAEQNNAVKAEVVRDKEVRLQAQGKLADMVEQFNRLMDEKRYAEAEVIARQANDTRFGLAAGIWTNNLSAMHKLAAKLKAGTVWGNCHAMIDPALPFGGYKESGLGREQGREGVEAYTELKSVIIAL